MLDMVMNSITLFVKGKLFKDVGAVTRQALIGIAITAALLVGLSFAPIPLWAAAAIAGLIGGALQPYLFKDLKYA